MSFPPVICSVRGVNKMSRLTERYKEKVFCKADCSEMIDYAEDCECPHLQKMKEKLAHYEDLEEQGLLLKKEDAVDEGYLYDWYIHSVSNDDEPVWTEAHIAELFNDFILIPKAEKALEEMKGE